MASIMSTNAAKVALSDLKKTNRNLADPRNADDDKKKLRNIRDDLPMAPSTKMKKAYTGYFTSLNEGMNMTRNVVSMAKGVISKSLEILRDIGGSPSSHEAEAFASSFGGGSGDGGGSRGSNGEPDDFIGQVDAVKSFYGQSFFDGHSVLNKIDEFSYVSGVEIDDETAEIMIQAKKFFGAVTEEEGADLSESENVRNFDYFMENKDRILQVLTGVMVTLNAVEDGINENIGGVHALATGLDEDLIPLVKGGIQLDGAREEAEQAKALLMQYRGPAIANISPGLISRFYTVGNGH